VKSFNVTTRSQRDPRLDVLRGMALITIFINHVPGNAYEYLTSRNFGFSDAAEGFVLMSGIAAGLAYSKGFGKLPFTEVAGRMWARARKLYFVHMLIIALAIAILWAGVNFLGTTNLGDRVNFTRILTEPAATVVGVLTLGHQLAYFNILPLYVMLLLAAPVFIMIGRRSLWGMIGVSAAIWFVSGYYRINMPNFPGDGGWFFNPFSWQFLFVIGLAGGMAAKQGRSLVPPMRWLFWAAVAYLLFSLYWLWVTPGLLPGSERLPFFVAGFDKTFLPGPRLLHVLALTYVLINLEIVEAFCRSRYASVLDTFGRNSLPVFASGSVMAMAFQLYGEVFETAFVADTILLGTGLVLQYWIALYVSRTPATRPAGDRLAPARIQKR